MSTPKAEIEEQVATILMGDDYFKNVKAISDLIRKTCIEASNKAVSDFCQEVVDKVRLEFEAGGRYPGHLIDPWTDVAHPIIYKQLERKLGK